jgi:probable phosphoglycerate mutase
MEVGPMHVTNNARVLLVRHGRTVLNAENRLRGRLDPELDDVGRVEVDALAELLAVQHPSRVVSSPLRRAVQTAEAIARRANVHVVQEQGLIDRDYGRWAGHTKDELVDRWGSVSAAPGVEDVDAVLYRACVVLDEQYDFLGPDPVVLVSHDAVNRALLAHLDPNLGPANNIDQRTACWNELVHVMGDWRVALVDQKPPVAAVGAR